MCFSSSLVAGLFIVYLSFYQFTDIRDIFAGIIVVFIADSLFSLIKFTHFPYIFSMYSLCYVVYYNRVTLLDITKTR